MHAINNVDLGISEDNSKFHCRSTWTQPTPRVQSPPHTSAHTLHPCTDAACLSWLLQGCSVRPRRKHSPAIAGVRIAHTARDSTLHGSSWVSSRCGMPCILHAPSPGYFSAHSSADDTLHRQEYFIVPSISSRSLPPQHSSGQSASTAGSSELSV